MDWPEQDPYWCLRDPEPTQFCDCPESPPIYLGGHWFNPFSCLACFQSVPPERIKPGDQLAGWLNNWCRMHAALHVLALGDEPYSAWAWIELRNVRSPVHARGLELRGHVDALYPCFYMWDRVPPGAPKCPLCDANMKARDAPLEKYEWCRRCRIVTLGTMRQPPRGASPTEPRGPDDA